MPRPIGPTLLLALVAGPAAVAGSFQLEGPLVSKVDWNTRGLSAGDLDGDGRADLALINNDRAQIDLLYQRTPAEMKEAARTKLTQNRWEPVLETAPFLKESVTTGDFMYDLALVDVDGDGMLDLVYTGKRDRIGVKLQTAPGEWEDEWSYDREEPNANVGSLAVADVDGDGRDDLAALTSDAILLFRLEGRQPALPRPHTYRVSEENPQRLQIRDLNGDGRPDLAYMAPSADRALRVRYQDAEGGFGPEFGVPVPVGSADWALLPCEDGPPLLATIKRTRNEMQFTPLVGTPGSQARRRSLAIRSYPVPKSGVNPALYALGDFDGDGRVDVVVADTDGSAVHLYVQGGEGEFLRPREFPSLQGITSIAAVRLPGDARHALLVCSEKEGMAGLSGVGDAGRLSFPENIPVPGQPLVAEAADLDGDGASEVIVATKDGRRFSLEVLRHDGETWTAEESVKLGSIKRNPTALAAHDLNGDGAPDLAMFIPREPMRLFVRDGDEFREVAEKDSVRTSQFEGVLPDRFGVGDFTGDGELEMLVAGKGFVRAYRIRPDGALEIVDQANARSSVDELSGPILFDLDGDGREELLSYLAEESRLQVLAPDEAGLYRYDDSLDLAPIGLVRVAEWDLGGDAGRRLLFFGKDRFWSVPPTPVGGAKESRRDSHRTDLEDVKYARFVVGDLDDDGHLDVIAADTERHVLEILSGGCGRPWKSELFFTVFEKNRFVRSTRGSPLQPRELLVGDFDNDGRSDLVLLCHDRVLLYPQRSMTEGE